MESSLIESQVFMIDEGDGYLTSGGEAGADGVKSHRVPSFLIDERDGYLTSGGGAGADGVKSYRVQVLCLMNETYLTSGGEAGTDGVQIS